MKAGTQRPLSGEGQTDLVKHRGTDNLKVVLAASQTSLQSKAVSSVVLFRKPVAATPCMLGRSLSLSFYSLSID